jgi:hypothetical protein
VSTSSVDAKVVGEPSSSKPVIIMKLFAIASIFGLVGLASSVSEVAKHRRDDSNNSTCVQQSDAQAIVDRFMSVMQHRDVVAANETVQALLTDDFTETSDSINTLSGQTVSSLEGPAGSINALTH